ncbi:MAG: RluA family pseudouridine synthase [Tissierellia bacterium]|nr:RluA family pseudouridine synthase [Tissierellia bacterium]
MNKLFYPEKEDQGQRLDLFLEGQLEGTRSQIKKAIGEGRVQVNGSQVKAGYKLKAGDQVAYQTQEDQVILPVDLDLEVLYEDGDLALINKPAGLQVHPGPSREERTLVHGLVHRFSQLAPGSGSYRPGIVHRLDKDTSGIMVVAKNQESFLKLVRQFKDQDVEKEYLALVQGRVLGPGSIDKAIGRSHRDRRKMAVDVSPARPAKTLFRPLEVFERTSLLSVDIRTGRTHQIRVHLSSLGYPLVGDGVYGKGQGAKRQLLHAYRLAISHPTTGKRLEAWAPLPQDLIGALEKEGSQWLKKKT